MLFAAYGIHHKYFGRCSVQGLFSFTRWCQKGTAPSMFWLLEPWKNIFWWTHRSTLWPKPLPFEFNSSLFCCCILWGWPSALAIPFIWTHVGWSSNSFRELFLPPIHLISSHEICLLAPYTVILLFIDKFHHNMFSLYCTSLNKITVVH